MLGIDYVSEALKSYEDSAKQPWRQARLYGQPLTFVTLLWAFSYKWAEFYGQKETFWGVLGLLAFLSYLGFEYGHRKGTDQARMIRLKALSLLCEAKALEMLRDMDKDDAEDAGEDQCQAQKRH